MLADEFASCEDVSRDLGSLVKAALGAGSLVERVSGEFPLGAGTLVESVKDL